MDTPDISKTPEGQYVKIAEITKIVREGGWHDPKFHVRVSDHPTMLSVTIMSQDKMTSYANFYASVSYLDQLTLTISTGAYNGDAEGAGDFLLAFSNVRDLAVQLETQFGAQPAV